MGSHRTGFINPKMEADEMTTAICMSCGGDGIGKPEVPLVGQPGCMKRCKACRGTGLHKNTRRRRRGRSWWSVQFKTNDGDMIRVTTQGATEDEALLNARRLLDPALHCEIL
jgi:DnaJ-class molecular chaperone